MKKILFAICAACLTIYGCKKDADPAPEPTPDPVNTTAPQLILKFKFDSTQTRLDNFGNVSTLPAGNSGQSPIFNSMSAHYVELTTNQLTALGAGTIIYESPKTTLGGDMAIDHNSSVLATENSTFLSIPLSSVAAGTYEYMRVSLSYQNYDIKLRVNSPSVIDLTGTLASFIGQNTYISSYTIKDSAIAVNANKLQGYWGFETIYNVTTGQPPPGSVTVPNPIFSTSPIPQGSCIVTGAFSPGALTITGSETSDIVITLSVSTNKSFEWKDADMDGRFEPLDGDTVVDMGIRGLIPMY
ncbi:MAG: hypothetical protein COB85_01810 [Bacteroidetes bacterium]|nr:MAG: hypothetical protein COB85_01810 [Bacteroidota bacterium]